MTASPESRPAPLVLVTGAPRSGTTVVGEILSGSPGARELYEPMSPVVGDRLVTRWFEIPGQGGFTAETADALIERIRRRKLQPTWRPGKVKRNPLLNRTRRTAMLLKLTPWTRSVIWKDPMAFFLLPHIVAQTDIPAIATVRDPLSLASSFQRMDWSAPVDELAPRMADAGLRVDPATMAAAQMPGDPVRRGAVLWNLIYACLLDWLRQGLPIAAMSNADVLADPVGVRERLRALTGLDVPEVGQADKPSAGAGDAPLPQKAHVQNRSAESITRYWEKTMAVADIAFCRDLNDGLWSELQAEIRGNPGGTGWHA